MELYEFASYIETILKCLAVILAVIGSICLIATPIMLTNAKKEAVQKSASRIFVGGLLSIASTIALFIAAKAVDEIAAGNTNYLFIFLASLGIMLIIYILLLSKIE